jgi:hypothetical protein
MDFPAGSMSFHDILHSVIMAHLQVSPTLVVAGVIGLLLLLIQYLSPQHEDQEPHLIPQRVPYVGHVLGLARHGITYYLNTR